MKKIFSSFVLVALLGILISLPSSTFAARTGPTPSSSTNFGVGTSTPTASLSVQGVTGTNPFKIASSTGATLFFIDQSGVLMRSNGYSSSTALSTATLLATEFDHPSILFTPNVLSTTVTTPATSTLSTSFLPNTGDVTEILIVNATSTAGKTVTLAAGSGFLFTNASSTLVMQPGGVISLRMIRLSTSDIKVQIIQSI